MKTYTITIYTYPKDNGYYALIPRLPETTTWGRTEEEAISSVEESFKSKVDEFNNKVAKFITENEIHFLPEDEVGELPEGGTKYISVLANDPIIFRKKG